MKPYALLLVLLLLNGALHSSTGKPDPLESVEVSGFMDSADFDYCYNSLNASDASGDGKVNSEEYVTFAKLMSPEGLLAGVDSFSQLPTEFQAAFLGTACLCQDPAFGGSNNDPNCCKGSNAYIRVPLDPPDEMDLQDRLYMYAACSYTSSAADAVGTVAPSPPSPPSARQPTAAPAPSTPTAPSVVATPQPTRSPASAPAARPTATVPGTVAYEIAVANGNTAALTPTVVEQYLSDLVQAMDILGPQVATETFGASRRRKLRRLSVTFVEPSTNSILTNFTCPSGTPTSSLCQTIEATIKLKLQDEPNSAAGTYLTALNQAIADGRLGEALATVNPQSVATILLPTATPASGLSAGATAGIVIAAVVAVGAVGFAIHKLSQKGPAAPKESMQPIEKDEELALDEADDKGGSAGAGAGEGDMSINSEDVYTKPEPEVLTAAAAVPAAAAVTTAAGSGKLLGASEPDYGRASRRAVEAMEAGEDIVAEPEMDVHPDSSSNAGSSGWSSSAGLSSLNTGSVDDSMDAAAAAVGATLASIGASSALAKKVDSDRTKSALDQPAVGGEPSRSQLDALIEAGDWAAVGATAALLAAASDSQSDHSRSDGSANVPREGRSLDAMRAAELDNLVDAGDWEGVVLAAAKFEAAESSAGSRSSMDNESLDTGTPGTGSAASPSIETSGSENASKIQRRAEIRKEVEALVRRVVPEEIDNIDEMMNQFKGREDELVETLRTMQERSVAQKARTAGQKAAKSEARRSVQRGVVPGVDASAGGDESGAGLGVGTVTGSASLEGGEPQAGGGDPRRTALEDAIEAGDWEAVGEAAAMMSDASVATASTGEIDRLADGMSAASSSAAGSSGGRRRLQLEGIDEDRARELDSMIDKGDWTGVVEATKKFKASDSKKKSARSKEEEEALAEAEAWMRIAEESKAAGSTDAGASDAAEWAIQRSLEQLKKKEEEQQKGKKGKDDEEEEV